MNDSKKMKPRKVRGQPLDVKRKANEAAKKAYYRGMKKGEQNG